MHQDGHAPCKKSHTMDSSLTTARALSGTPRRTILITGASGRLGSALVRALGENHAIVQFDVRAPHSSQYPLGRVVVGSVTDFAAVVSALEGVDTVIHAAAVPSDIPDPEKLVATNVLGTFHVLEAAGRGREVEQFIYISSIRWHGLFDAYLSDAHPLYLPIDERHPSFAVSPYACSKVQGEVWCKAYVKRFKKPAIAIRPSWIIPLEREGDFSAQKAPEKAHLLEYVGTSDVIRGVALALEYYPKDGFDVFLLNAADQWSTTPSLEWTGRHFPSVPVDRLRLCAVDGFGALVNCMHVEELLGWRPAFRCKRGMR